MAGDYSRFRFNVDKNYSEVRQQQGRVSLDADWNEGEAIVDRHWRSETFDILGRCVVPATTPQAFEIVPTAPGEFTIGVGRLYLDGLQVENHGLFPQFDPVLAELHGTGAVPYAAPPGNPMQPYYPTAPAVTLPAAGRNDLVYLHVWQREVTALEDPQLLEVALGGADTTTRLQTAWQVQVLEGVGDAHCVDELDAWNDLIEPSAGRLTTDQVAPGGDKPCIISPAGGYRGLENRLYRVEIHTPGPLGTAKFKWSRDNVSVRAAVDAISVGLDQITVRELGRDQVLRFNVGDWVEVLDDNLEFRIQAGESVSAHMAKITAIDEANGILTVSPSIPAGLGLDATDPKRHTRVQRWDQSVGVDANGLLDTAAGPLELEDGVLASFNIDPTNPGGEFKRGDYWVFTARTADGLVEQLNAAPPRGIHHHYCRLAVTHWGPTVDTTHVHDCRTIWPPAQCCTIAVRPGEDIQAAIDRVPADGGCICLLPGLHRIHEPLLIDGRQNINFKGVGPASKLIYESIDPQITYQATLYVVGGSRDIHISDLLIYGDSLPHLVVVDEDSQDIHVRACQLINATLNRLGTKSDCLLLGHCCEVHIADSRLLGVVDVAQATQAQLADIDAELAAMRPPPVDDTGGDGVGTGDDVTPPPEPRWVKPLKHLQANGNTLYFNLAGLLLLDGLKGRVSDNSFQTVTVEDLESFARPESLPPEDEFYVPFDPELFFGGLDDQLAVLSPCAPPPVDQEESIAVWGTLLHDYQIRGNTMIATIGIQINTSRAVHTRDNKIEAQKMGIYLGYAFDAEVCDSEIDIPVTDDKLDQSPSPDAWEMWSGRFRTETAAVAVFFTRGFRVCKNRLDAHAGVCTAHQPKAPVEPQAVPRDSLLRVLGIQRLWRVSVELAWFFYQLFRLLSQTPVVPPVAGEPNPKERFEQRMFEGLVELLGGRYFTYFVGKAEISDNRMHVTHSGVLFHSILSIGGLKILRNRVSGQRRAGIHVHPWFSVGRVDDFAKWTRCTLKWLLAVLALFRDALRDFLQDSTDEERPDTGLMGWVAAGVSWVLVLCSRYCGGQPTGNGDGDGNGETPPTPAEVLKQALDEFLDNLDPTWLDDLVNQAYVIDGNVLSGAGDGVVTGLDGTRISHNQVTIWPATPVPFEIVVFGLRFKAQFENIDMPYYTSEAEMLAESSLQADRDTLFISAMFAQTWVDDLWDEPGYRDALRNFLQNWSAYVNSASPLAPYIQDMADGLDETSLDQAKVSQAWRGVLIVMVWELNGYGIVMLGADMDCHHNRVESRTGCGSDSLDTALWGKRDLAASVETTASASHYTAAQAQRAYEPLLFTSPGLGGIWQTSNFLSWGIDILRLIRTEKVDNQYQLVVGLLAYLVLYQSSERNQRVNENHVENALVHGIRTMNLYGSDETEVMDNVVRNASRHGIYHLSAPFVDSEDPVTIKVHRNTVLHAEGSSAFDAVPGRSWDFASLIWVENGDIYGSRNEEGYGTTLLSLNHGDGGGLMSVGGAAGNLSSAAVYVETSVAGVTTNHILSNADFAFSIQASKGLFTDNIADKGRTLSNPAIAQGPDVIV